MKKEVLLNAINSSSEAALMRSDLCHHQESLNEELGRKVGVLMTQDAEIV